MGRIVVLNENQLDREVIQAILSEDGGCGNVQSVPYRSGADELPVLLLSAVSSETLPGRAAVRQARGQNGQGVHGLHVSAPAGKL